MGEPKLIEPNIRVSDVTQWGIYSVSNCALSEVYLMDCIAGMKHYPDKFFDLAVVDPPYGIDATKLKIRANKKEKQWDSKTPTKEYFDELFRVSKNQVIWGMNFLNDYLPRCDKTIIWDKQNDGTYGSDYELAWTSFDGVKQHICRIMWYGYFYPKEELPLLHPTQKPVKLYDWIFDKFAEKGQKILDTNLGSGSSRIAANKAGLDFVGFEIDEDYFNASEDRFKKFVSQTRLF